MLPVAELTPVSQDARLVDDDRRGRGAHAENVRRCSLGIKRDRQGKCYLPGELGHTLGRLTGARIQRDDPHFALVPLGQCVEWMFDVPATVAKGTPKRQHECAIDGHLLVPSQFAQFPGLAADRHREVGHLVADRYKLDVRTARRTVVCIPTSTVGMVSTESSPVMRVGRGLAASLAARGESQNSGSNDDDKEGTQTHNMCLRLVHMAPSNPTNPRRPYPGFRISIVSDAA